MKRQRQASILEIIRQRDIRSQAELVEALALLGISANQATVSRDLRELGLVRLADQRYAKASSPPESEDGWDELHRLFRLYVKELDGNTDLLMIKTGPGAAHMVAAAIDSLREPDVVGTLAGDDTLLVMPRTRKARKELEQRFRGMTSRA